MSSIPVIPMAGENQAAISTFINRVYKVNEDGTVGPRLDHILDEQAAELAGRYTKEQVDAGLAGKENVFAGVILPPSTMDEVIALGPGTHEWIQPVRLPWEPPEIPNAPIRVIFSAIFTDVGALKCCRLRCIDGAINLSEYILEPYGDGFRSAPLATAASLQWIKPILMNGWTDINETDGVKYGKNGAGTVFFTGLLRPPNQITSDAIWAFPERYQSSKQQWINTISSTGVARLFRMNGLSVHFWAGAQATTPDETINFTGSFNADL